MIIQTLQYKLKLSKSKENKFYHKINQDEIGHAYKI